MTDTQHKATISILATNKSSTLNPQFAGLKGGEGLSGNGKCSTLENVRAPSPLPDFSLYMSGKHNSPLDFTWRSCPPILSRNIIYHLLQHAQIYNIHVLYTAVWRSSARFVNFVLRSSLKSTRPGLYYFIWLPGLLTGKWRCGKWRVECIPDNNIILHWFLTQFLFYMDSLFIINPFSTRTCFQSMFSSYLPISYSFKKLVWGIKGWRMSFLIL